MKKRKREKEKAILDKSNGDNLIETLRLRKIYDNRPATSLKSLESKGKIEYKTAILGVIYNGVAKTKSMMREKFDTELEIERDYLHEILSDDILEISKEDGLPILNLFALMHFMERGIITKYQDNIVIFKNIQIGKKDIFRKKIKKLFEYYEKENDIITEIEKLKFQIQRKEKIAGDRVLDALNKILVESEKELKLIKEQIKILLQDLRPKDE